MTEVEIYWPATQPSDHVFAAEAVLRDAGVHATCRLQPTRRGSETVLVLLTNAAIGPFFGALFGKLGDEAWIRLRAFIDHLLKHTRERPAPGGVVVFESAANCAQSQSNARPATGMPALRGGPRSPIRRRRCCHRLGWIEGSRCEGTA